MEILHILIRVIVFFFFFGSGMMLVCYADVVKQGKGWLYYQAMCFGITQLLVSAFLFATILLHRAVIILPI